LGDSFDQVDSVVHLNHDPNGPNQGGLWSKGRFTDFYSTDEPSVIIDKESRLNPAILCTFDPDRRLRSFTVTWLYDGDRNIFGRRKFFGALMEKEHVCWSPEKFDTRKTMLTDTSDLGNAFQTFEYEFGQSWTASYTIAMK